MLKRLLATGLLAAAVTTCFGAAAGSASAAPLCDDGTAWTVVRELIGQKPCEQLNLLP